MSNNELDPHTEQKLHELYQSVEKEQPPNDIDQLILTTAHEAVKIEKVTQLTNRRRTWYVPVSVAAVIVISFSVVLTLDIEQQIIQPESELHGLDAVQESEAPMMLDDKAASSIMPEPVERLSSPGAGQSNVTQALTKQKRQMADQEKKQAVVTQRNQQAEIAASPMASKAQLPSVQSFSSTVDMPVEADAAVPSMDESIQYMQRLLEAEQYADLKYEMLIFRESHPDYELPPALRQWEQQMSIEDSD